VLSLYLLQNKAQNDREAAVLDKLFEQKQQYVYSCMVRLKM